MSIAVPISFVHFHFHNIYHDKNESYTPKVTIDLFEDGVQECTPPATGQDCGSLLKLEQWPERGGPLNRPEIEDPLVLVQILHVMPLKINNEVTRPAVLHEVAMVAWACRSRGSMSNPFEDWYRMTRRPETSMYLVLNSWLGMTMLHTYERGHLALVFTKVMFERLMDLSLQIDASLQDEIDLRGTVVTLGRTDQEAAFHCENFHKARTLSRRVFELIDLAYASVEANVFNTILSNIGLFITGNLDMVRAVQARPGEDEEDFFK